MVVSMKSARQMANSARRGHLNDLGHLLMALIRGEPYQTYAGTPVGNLVPSAIGEWAFDSTNKAWYKATGLTSADWSMTSIQALSAAELALLDTALAGTVVASKAVIYGAAGEVATSTAGVKSDGVTMSQVKWVDVAVTAALLDAAGNVPVIAGVAGDQYKIRNIILVGGGTNFGAGGDRLISLTDGTTVWTTIANTDIETAPSASLMWGNAKVPFLTGTSNTASASNAAIRFQYSGGTTDHGGTGSITFSVCLEKVA